MATQIPSGFRLGPDPLHDGQFSQGHVSCGAAPGAQVRLMRPTHWALSITAPSAIKVQLAKEQELHSKSVNCGSAERYMGDAGPREGGNAWPGPRDPRARHRVESAAAWRLRAWGSGLILPLSILSQCQSLRLQTTGLGGRVPRAHPRVLTKRAWMLRRESGKER